MDINFTRLLHYYQIDTSEIDLFSDAFGFDYSVQELIPGYMKIWKKPDDKIVSKLLLAIDRVADTY